MMFKPELMDTKNRSGACKEEHECSASRSTASTSAGRVARNTNKDLCYNLICECETISPSFLIQQVRSHILQIQNKLNTIYEKIDECHLKSPQAEDLKGHKETLRGGTKLKCDKCYYRTTQPESLQNHKLTHARNTLNESDKCDTQPADLKCQNLTQTEAQLYKCSMCNYKSLYLSHLKCHKLTHLGGKPHKGGMCDNKTAQSDDSKCDKLTQKEETPYYECDICNYKVMQPSLLKRHKLTHTRAKLNNIKCNMCDYRSSVSKIKHHQIIHAGDQHECTMCDYKSIYLNDFKRHQVTHRKGRIYGCNWCDFKSKRLSYMRFHRLRHTGEKPYECDMCDFKSAYANNLTKHKLIHAKEAKLTQQE